MKNKTWKIICFDELTSTNDLAAQYAQAKTDDMLVIKAKKQTAGRGRRGHLWQSLEGNLFFSLLFKSVETNIGMFVIISALSLLQSLKILSPSADVLLKWPNDVLLNNKKVSGILLEIPENGYMIIGIGVNIIQSPKSDAISYPVTSLRESGIQTTADEFLQIYLKQFDNFMKLFHKSGFEPLRRMWLDNAKKIGSKIMVCQNNTQICGVFEGIDENANLLLRNNEKLHKILAGDVFYEEQK